MYKLATFSPAYFPSLEYFWYLVQADHVVLTDHFQFTKQTTITRSAKLNFSDPVLSIPVRHSDDFIRICDVRTIDGEHWRKKHYSNIYHQYHGEPYAYFYLPQIKDLIYSDTQNLSDYIFNILKHLIDWLHFGTRIYQASKFGFKTENFNSIIDWCRATFSNTYLYQEEVFKNNWLNKKDFKDTQINLELFKSFPSAHIIESNRILTALSFLFQYGPEAGYIIRQYQSK